MGFYSPDGAWNPDSDHSSREDAAKRVHYLNGGHEVDDGEIVDKFPPPMF